MLLVQEDYVGNMYVCSCYHSASSHLAGSDRASGGGAHKGISHPRRQHHRPAGPRTVRRHHTAGMLCYDHLNVFCGVSESVGNGIPTK